VAIALAQVGMSDRASLESAPLTVQSRGLGHANSASELPMHETELSNGLRVVTIPTPHLRRSFVGLYTRVGSRFENEKSHGLSHFLEHMLYRGTVGQNGKLRYDNAHEVTRAFEELGGSLYGATHVDMGVFSVSIPNDNLERATERLGAVLASPAFRDIDLERGIVREEILEDLDEEGREINADNLSRKLIYGKHALGFTITGTQAQVDGFQIADLRAHHSKHYTSGNSVLVFAGNVDASLSAGFAEHAFGWLSKGGFVAADAPPRTQRKPRIRYVPNASSQTELRLCFRTEGLGDARRAGLEMLMRIIDDGMSTRLYHRICDRLGLCYEASGYYDGYEDDGVVDFAASVANERAHVVTEEILRLMKEIAAHGPTSAELDQAKNRMKWDAEALVDLPEDAAFMVGASLLQGRKIAVEQIVAERLAVNLEDVRNAAQNLLAPERFSAVYVGHLPNAEQVEEIVRSFG
jgi:predicted Zn-dependent peptidase